MPIHRTAGRLGAAGFLLHFTRCLSTEYAR
jgi:hypothetical protein